MALTISHMHEATLWVDGVGTLGQIGSMTLPSIEQQITEHEALGMYGTTGIASGLSMMEFSCTILGAASTVIGAVMQPNKVSTFQVRANNKLHTATGVTNQPYVVEMRGRPQMAEMGEISKTAAKTGTVSMTVDMVRVIDNGSEVFMVDVNANIYRVGGVDLLADMRRNLGLD